ncbi:MAG: NUDIX hydrolase [Solirubrobacterales bacterium]|nr:NUDIX hydrolase [Solirubrobacterales bacterium]
MAQLPEPGPSERINLGDPTEPRAAATVILLRDNETDGTLEVLLLRRSENARFMPNVWVFPGGALDPEDGDGLDGLKTCAIRELHEEAGVELDPSTRLVPLARWVTPEVIKTRFDTWFFLAESPAGIEITPDGSEMTADRWVSPAQALAEYETGEFAIVFPTVKQLEALVLSPDSKAAMAAAEADPNSSRKVLPKVIGDERHHRVVLPHEDDYPVD